VKRIFQLGLTLVVIGLVSAPAWAQSPAGDKPTGDKPAGAKPAGDKPAGVKPAGDKPAGDKPARVRPREPYPEDRPFVGNPGGDPGPPPARPRAKRIEPRPTRPTRPTRPVEPGADKPAKPKDLLEPPGPNVIAAGIGPMVGLTGASTGGFRLNLEWSYQLARLFWFDVIGGVNFGGACKVSDTNGDGRNDESNCELFRGVGIDLLAGLQMKFVNVRLWKAPVVPFARLAVGVAGIIVTDAPNDGAALVFRLGGGFRYYFRKWFSLGAELAFTVGPAFRNHEPVGAYAVLTLLVGVEFLL